MLSIWHYNKLGEGENTRTCVCVCVCKRVCVCPCVYKFVCGGDEKEIESEFECVRQYVFDLTSLGPEKLKLAI